MDTREFVSALGKVCRDSAIEDCVEIFQSPPGRRPSPELIALSQWFGALPLSEREMVIRAMHEAADSTLFGVLCVLDGVRAIENSTEQSQFQLTATKKGVISVLCPGEEFLHDIYKAEP